MPIRESEVELKQPELKSCPFCGGRNIHLKSPVGYDEWLVGCDDCDGRIYKFVRGREKAITLWNTRPAESRLEAANGELVEALDEIRIGIANNRDSREETLAIAKIALERKG